MPYPQVQLHWWLGLQNMNGEHNLVSNRCQSLITPECTNNQKI
jgi:hypothetical protein